MGKKVLAGLAISLLALLLILFIIQYSTYKSEENELSFHLEERRRYLDRVRIAEGDREGLERQLNETEYDISKALALVPVSLDVDRFLESFRRLAESSHVSVQEHSHKESKGEFYSVSELSFRLSAAEADMEGFWRRIDDLERLVKWIERRAMGSGYEIKFRIFAMPWLQKKQHDENRLMKSLCQEFGSEVWLWPFSERLAEIKMKLDNLCSTLRKHAVTVEALERYQSRKADLKKITAIVDHLGKGPE